MSKTSFLLILLPAILLLLRTESARGAHSRRRPGASPARRGRGEDRYDRSITTFDAAGRLQQVEYARRSAGRGATLLAYVHCEDDADGVDGAEAAAGGTASRNATARLPETIFVLVATSQPPCPGMVETAPTSESAAAAAAAAAAATLPANRKVHRLDHHLFLLTAGLAGDGRYLADVMRREFGAHRCARGCPPTPREAARAAARLQHALTRSGGARPLGATALVAGLDPAACTGGAQLFRTDPGGFLEECRYFAAGRHQEAILRAMPDVMRDHLDDPGLRKDAIVAALVRVVAKASDDDEQAWDVWIIERNNSRRGNVQATCLLGVTTDNVDTVVKTKLAILSSPLHDVS